MRTYGKWAGNPKGTPENKKNCIVEVPRDGDKYLFKQCSRPRKYGDLCSIHERHREKNRPLDIPEDK